MRQAHLSERGQAGIADLVRAERQRDELRQRVGTHRLREQGGGVVVEHVGKEVELLELGREDPARLSHYLMDVHAWSLASHLVAQR